MNKSEKDKDQETTAGSGVTRREWLLSLGSAVILSGFRGWPLEGAQEAHGSGTPLPPGVYQPSLDHLTHVLSNESPFVSAPAGAETEYVRPNLGSFVPRGMTPKEFAVVRRLVEIILGEDLRSAGDQHDAGAAASIHDEVAEWIDLVIASAPAVRRAAGNLPAEQRALAVAYLGSEEPVLHLEKFEPERICSEGLFWLAEESRRQFAKEFLDVPAAEQAELVESISELRPDRSVTNAGIRLFVFLKEEAIRGFYTSRLGLKELDYRGNSFYGESPGCALPRSD